MLQRFLLTTLRRLRHDKLTTFINFAGLTIGLVAAMLIGLYVLNEWRTDRGLPEPERTFRLVRESDINNEAYLIGITSPPFATALEQDFDADVAETARVLDGNSLVSLGEKRFLEENYYYADANFLTFFGFNLLHGDAATALVQPHSVVLTEATAKRYFGSAEAAMGQTLRIDDDYDALVTGVVAAPTTPTHFQFDLIESTASLLSADWWSGWWNNNLCTYLRLAPGASAASLESRLPGFMDKYFGKDFERTGTRIELRLQPIRSVYFAADVRYDPMRHGNSGAVSIFLLAALLLIGIACANYINLSTAKAVERGQEIAIRKVLGSSRTRIVNQLLSESFLLTSVAVLAATSLTITLLPAFERYFELDLQLILPAWTMAALLTALVAVVTLLSGLYPGWYLSSFRPALALKDRNAKGGKSAGGLRQGLVVGQFALSIVLLCGTLVIKQQLDFLRNKDLGFDKEHVVLVDINNPSMYEKRESFRQELLREPGVSQVAYMVGYPGGFHDATTVDAPELNQSLRMRTAFVDFNFAQTLDLDIIAGRDFDPRLASDSSRAVLLNERAVADLGSTPEEILNTRLVLTSFDTIPRRVVGVVRNYHFAGLQETIEPIIIATAFWGGDIAIKAQGDRLPAVIAAAERAWNSHAPAFPFTYHFLDERLERLYQSEARQGRIFQLFAVIAIFIACLGMFGLAAFAASTRTKEIGIRKVLGASVAGIVLLLSRDFLKLVGLALLIALPAAWYLMNNWLDDFAYRIDIPWWVFAVAGVLALGVALLTISFQSIRAALANPVESLRRE